MGTDLTKTTAPAVVEATAPEPVVEARVDPDPPVYDERGNVRPRGTEGTRPMTLAERKAIARKLHKS